MRATRILGRTATAIGVAACLLSCAPAGRSFTEDEEQALGEADRGLGEGPVRPHSGGAGMRGVATFTVADVARIVVVLEQTAIAQARVGQGRAGAIEVKTYAARMVRERSEAIARLSSIVRRATPRSADPTPALLESDAQRTIDALAALPSAGFDLPFMTAEVATHARLLGLIDASLLPSVSQARARAGGEGLPQELEEQLLELRAITATHVVHALRVQGVLRAADPPSADATEVEGADVDISAASGPREADGSGEP